MCDDANEFDDHLYPVKSNWPATSTDVDWVDWVIAYIRGYNDQLYDRRKNVKFASVDHKYGITIPSPDPLYYQVFGSYLAYFGSVYNYQGLPYTETAASHGKTAVEYPFHDGNIQYPQGYFTGIATGFATQGKVLYSGEMHSAYDTPQVGDANFYVNKDGDIYVSISKARKVVEGWN